MCTLPVGVSPSSAKVGPRAIIVFAYWSRRPLLAAELPPDEAGDQLARSPQRGCRHVGLEDREQCRRVGQRQALAPIEPQDRHVSYLLCYHRVMAQREKRSVSLPPDLARAVEQDAKAEGTTFSAWLAQTAAHRLKLEAGRQAIAEWERENGPLTEAELADGLARARSSLGRAPAAPSERRSA